MSDFANRVTKNIRLNMFAKDINSKFTSKLGVYKFIRYIGNRFTSKRLDFKDLPWKSKSLLKETFELTGLIATLETGLHAT